MPRYFMGDTRLGWLEKMMMDPSRPTPSRTDCRRKMPQKKMPCNRPVKPQPPERKTKEGGV